MTDTLMGFGYFATFPILMGLAWLGHGRAALRSALALFYELFGF